MTSNPSGEWFRLLLDERANLEAMRQVLFRDGHRPSGLPPDATVIADVDEHRRQWLDCQAAGNFNTTVADVMVDVDGIPSGVGESTTVLRLNFMGLSRAEADRLGISAAIEAGEYPNVHVVEGSNHV